MKTEIKWGLIFSAVLFGWIVLEYFVGLHDRFIAWHSTITSLFFFPAVAMMVLAAREKKRVQGGRITFLQAFFCGLGVSVIVSLLTPLSQFLFHRFVNPNFFTEMIRYAVAHGQTLQAAQSEFNLRNYSMIGSLAGLVYGILTAAVVAAFLRTKTKPSLA